MAKFKVATNTEFKQDNAGGTALNFTAYIDTINNPPGKEVAQLDTTTFNDAGGRFIAGIEEAGEYTLVGAFDDTAVTGPDITFSLLVGTLGSFDYYPHGTASGDRRFSGESLCVSYKTSAAVRDRVGFEARFVIDGTVTVTTV